MHAWWKWVRVLVSPMKSIRMSRPSRLCLDSDVKLTLERQCNSFHLAPRWMQSSSCIQRTDRGPSRNASSSCSMESRIGVVIAEPPSLPTCASHTRRRSESQDTLLVFCMSGGPHTLGDNDRRVDESVSYRSREEAVTEVDMIAPLSSEFGQV